MMCHHKRISTVHVTPLFPRPTRQIQPFPLRNVPKPLYINPPIQPMLFHHVTLSRENQGRKITATLRKFQTVK
ncbi:hypothetical protein RJT34_26212 [Clitoria ternatea]|uniref:Uncharacterized protein n=1 Tax=Clitoria ternatea TaxID=43366 RepID=A0AAN9IBF4_CLITE